MCRAQSLSPTDHLAAFYLALQLAVSRQVIKYFHILSVCILKLTLLCSSIDSWGSGICATSTTATRRWCPFPSPSSPTVVCTETLPWCFEYYRYGSVRVSRELQVRMCLELSFLMEVIFRWSWGFICVFLLSFQSSVHQSKVGIHVQRTRRSSTHL